MIKLLNLLLDLLQIPFSTQHLELAEKLINKPSSKIISFYNQGFVFFAFQDMLLGKISQEEFVALWDTFWNLYNYQNNPIFAKESLVYWLMYDTDIYADSFILVSKEEKDYLENKIPSLIDILDKIKSQIIYL